MMPRSWFPLLKGLSAPSTPTYFQFISTSNCSVFTEPAAWRDFYPNKSDRQDGRRTTAPPERVSVSGPSCIHACSCARTAPGLRFHLSAGAPDPSWSCLLSSPDNSGGSKSGKLDSTAKQWLFQSFIMSPLAQIRPSARHGNCQAKNLPGWNLC